MKIEDTCSHCGLAINIKSETLPAVQMLAQIAAAHDLLRPECKRTTDAIDRRPAS